MNLLNKLEKTITVYNHGTEENPIFKMSIQDTENNGYTDHNIIECMLHYNIKTTQLHNLVVIDGYDIDKNTFSKRVNRLISQGNRKNSKDRFRHRAYIDGWLFAYDDTNHVVKVINVDSGVCGYAGYIGYHYSFWSKNSKQNTQIKIKAKKLKHSTSHKRILEIKIDKTPETIAIERAKKAESKLKSLQQQVRVLKSKGSDDLERNLIKDDYTKQLIKLAQQLEEKGVDVLSTLEELNNKNDENKMNEQQEPKRVSVSSCLTIAYEIKEADETSITVSVEIPEDEDELLVDLTGLEDIFVGFKPVSEAPPAVLDNSLDVDLTEFEDLFTDSQENSEHKQQTLLEQLQVMNDEELHKTYFEYLRNGKLDDITEDEFDTLYKAVVA